MASKERNNKHARPRMQTEEVREVRLLIRGRESINFFEGYAQMMNFASLEALFVDVLNRDIPADFELSHGEIEAAMKTEGKHKLEVSA